MKRYFFVLYSWIFMSSILLAQGLPTGPMTYHEIADNDRKSITEKTSKEIYDLIKKSPAKYFLVDVREPEEMSEGKIKNSINIPRGVVEKYITKYVQPNDDKKTLIVHCNTGHRSAMASVNLLKMGYHLINMSDGTYGWKQNGLPLEKP